MMVRCLSVFSSSIYPFKGVFMCRSLNIEALSPDESFVCRLPTTNESCIREYDSMRQDVVFHRDKDENDDDTLQVYLISFSDANFTICIVESLSSYTRDFFFLFIFF